jgi:hypothetical protein
LQEFELGASKLLFQIKFLFFVTNFGWLAYLSLLVDFDGDWESLLIERSEKQKKKTDLSIKDGSCV